MNKQQSASPVRININSHIFNAVFFIFQDIALSILILGTMTEKNLKGKTQNINSEKTHDKNNSVTKTRSICQIHSV